MVRKHHELGVLIAILSHLAIVVPLAFILPLWGRRALHGSYCITEPYRIDAAGDWFRTAGAAIFRTGKPLGESLRGAGGDAYSLGYFHDLHTRSVRRYFTPSDSLALAPRYLQ